MLTKKLTEDFYWVGNLDPDLRIFDIVMYTEHGTTYNSYILKAGDKTILFEAAKLKCYNAYLKRLADITPLEDIDYLVVSHTEPDHSGTIEEMLDINPNLTILGSMGAGNFLKEITNREDFNFQAVTDGEELKIGNKTLKFMVAPNLHWPDTIFTYIPEEKVLVTCDAFGAHYSDENITDDHLVSREDYLKTAKYYFDNIIGPFKADMRKAIDRIRDLDIKVLAVGHGPVLIKHIDEIINLNAKWSEEPEKNEKKTVIIPYVTAYGYTKMIADAITRGIKSVGDIDVKHFDMVYANFDNVMEEIAKAEGVMLGTPTIVGEALPPIWNIVASMNAKIHGGKVASAFGSFGWSGEGVPNIMGRLQQLKLQVYGSGLRVRFKPSEKQLESAFIYGKEFAEML